MVMRVIEVPEKARVFLGAPASPLPQALADCISRALYTIEGVEELHLPQCFAIGSMKVPAVVLVILVGKKVPLRHVARRAMKQLKRIVTPEQDLDLWVLDFDSSFASAVRHANCLLERDLFSIPAYRKPKFWWRLLGAR